ncbi:MAG TPA: C4-type zinc ribbon domain-containing protein [Clostridia bacterium]|jgi:predicted  nucleic acid-binding Zn-ribbon protein|nr:C4-type zinc ribbon domain-containing protein [Clostridia bacterium]HUM60188.1 C4-type zinc ribbon domain-containing protein [Clostridia bacterium]
MTQLDLLWEYQLADTEADNMAQSIRQSPKRQKLLKLRDYIREQQESLNTLENELHAMSDRMDVLKEAISLADDQLKDLQKRVQDEQPGSSQEIAQFITQADELFNTLNDYDQEIRRVRKSAENRDRRQRDIKLRAIRSKEEFDQLRIEYDQEYKEKSEILEQLRAVAEQKKKDILPEYLARYTAIKQHSTPPMAKLINGQCGGCNMGFPSSDLAAIRAGKQVECETCGRLIIG